MDQQSLNPYAAPQHDGLPAAAQYSGQGYRAYLDGTNLVLSTTASLPPVCVKCATADGVTRRHQKFRFTPPWVIALLMVCTLGAVIAMAVTTKRAELSLPICEPCNTRWGSAKWAFGLSIGGLIVAGALLGVMSDTSGPSVILFGLVVLAIVAVVVVGITITKPRTLQVKKIDKEMITLIGVHPNAAETIVRSASGGWLRQPQTT
jgi:hypothetical protein